MNIKEFLDDEEPIDPKKFFDENEYSTLIIDRSGFNKKDNNIADLIESLLDKNVTRKESEDIFAKLKEASAQDLLVKTITTAERANEKSILAAACWESGLDFTSHFLFFVELALHEDFQLALEALSVVQNIEGKLNEETLNKAVDLIDAAHNYNPDIYLDLQTNVRSRF
jgi:hypothetical protein